MATRSIAAFVLATVLASSTAVASTSETGSDGLPLNGMAPLYLPLPRSDQRGVSALITLPQVAANKHWYANWVMIVGQPAGAAHPAFVQVGLIRRPDQNRLPYMFYALQTGQQPRIEYRQLQAVSDSPHRFTIEQIRDVFILIADGRELTRLRMSGLGRAHSYAQIGPEVSAEGEALSGEVLYAAVSSNNAWKGVGNSNTCRYENHGVSLLIAGRVWTSTGQFDRKQPSSFKGNCSDI